MDLFDFDKILELLRLDAGHKYVQTFLLFLIWLQSRGVRKEIAYLKKVVESLEHKEKIRIEAIPEMKHGGVSYDPIPGK